VTNTSVIYVTTRLTFSFEAAACTCHPVSAPEAYWNASAVFVGRVVDVGLIDDASHRLPAIWVRFRVNRAYRGVPSDGAYVIVLSAARPETCGYPFREGVRYLVYADRDADGDTLRTSICSRTRPTSAAAEDLVYIESIRIFRRPRLVPDRTAGPADRGRTARTEGGILTPIALGGEADVFSVAHSRSLRNSPFAGSVSRLPTTG
jgi:hypothetical protein